ncbi:ricin-type beta-trefoil lectin domain protein [Streptomyces sp. NPDC059161]|uniref:RICIN domain-containing protein n=1 Tax=unclassified Streptomyces TaxID=2593676 RepID=UPI00366139A1
MIRQRIGRLVGAALVAPLLVVGASAAAHADGDVVWNHKNGGGCLSGMWDHHSGWNDVGLYPCSFGASQWHDVNVGGNVFIERMAQVPGSCLAGYTDHDAYVEACSSGQNDYQRWREINTGDGWKLQNVATGECLDANDASKVYTHECNDGNVYQLWS